MSSRLFYIIRHTYIRSHTLYYRIVSYLEGSPQRIPRIEPVLVMREEQKGIAVIADEKDTGSTTRPPPQDGQTGTTGFESTEATDRRLRRRRLGSFSAEALFAVTRRDDAAVRVARHPGKGRHVGGYC